MKLSECKKIRIHFCFICAKCSRVSWNRTLEVLEWAILEILEGKTNEDEQLKTLEGKST